MKTLILILCVISSACALPPKEAQPGRLIEHTLESGKTVLVYVPGYSVEDFKRDFYQSKK